MLIGEVIQRVQALYSKGTPSDDSRLSNRHIYNKLRSIRAMLLSQSLNKKQKVSEWNYQTIPCIELIEIDINECPCTPQTNCKILRSKYKLPKPLLSLSDVAIKNVSTIDRKKIFDKYSLSSHAYKIGNKFTSEKESFFFEAGFLYIFSKTPKKVIRLVGLFEDPVEVENYILEFCNDCTDCITCLDYLNISFPIDESMIDTVVQLAAEELIILFSKAQEDTSSNTSDNIRENV